MNLSWMTITPCDKDYNLLIDGSLQSWFLMTPEDSGIRFILFFFVFLSCFEREYTNGLFHALVGFFKSTQFTLVSYTPSHALVVSLYSFTIFVNLFPFTI